MKRLFFNFTRLWKSSKVITMLWKKVEKAMGKLMATSDASKAVADMPYSIVYLRKRNKISA